MLAQAQHVEGTIRDDSSLPLLAAIIILLPTADEAATSAACKASLPNIMRLVPPYILSLPLLSLARQNTSWVQQGVAMLPLCH